MTQLTSNAMTGSEISKSFIATKQNKKTCLIGPFLVSTIFRYEKATYI